MNTLVRSHYTLYGLYSLYRQLFSYFVDVIWIILIELLFKWHKHIFKIAPHRHTVESVWLVCVLECSASILLNFASCEIHNIASTKYIFRCFRFFLFLCLVYVRFYSVRLMTIIIIIIKINALGVFLHSNFKQFLRFKWFDNLNN